MREVLREHRPTIVFHAAAYKHVGLMEANPVEAVRNNAIATRVVAHVSGEHGVDRFVLVSTDKAVAPATVMGASKALAEFALEAATARFPGTRYAAVRFGNVLGSSGSVVPIFRRQIERGGPVTVTDERMTRYFMTIPEAVQLIIRTGSRAWAAEACRTARAEAARDGLLSDGHALPGFDGAGARAGAEVFVLNMGEPVTHRRSCARDDRAVGARPRPRHRDRDHRTAPGREAPRGAVQQLRAPAADERREDPAGRTRAAGGRGGRVDVRGDRPARARGRRCRTRGEGVGTVGRAVGLAGRANGGSLLDARRDGRRGECPREPPAPLIHSRDS